jgi:hypothetical protein
MLTVSTPLYLVESNEACWTCNNSQVVIALATDHILDDSAGDPTQPDQSALFTLLSDIEEMPVEVYEFVAAQHSRYKKHYSKTVEFEYYANICTCGANFGDWYLFCEPGGAFFPESEEDARLVKLIELPFRGRLEFSCSYSQGAGDLIRDNAQRM